MSDNPTPVLGYGQQQTAWYARMRSWRVVVLLLLLVGATVALFHYAPPFADQYELLRLQNRLKSDFLPAGTVVYTEDDAVAKRLEDKPKYAPYVIHNSPNQRMPARLQYLDQAGIPTTNGGAILPGHFRGLRTSPSGVPMLVGIGFGLFPHQSERYAMLTYTTVTLATWTPGSRGKGQSLADFFIRLGENDRLTLYAGQPDPNDRSHLTIDYDINGQHGVIDGRLDDYGRVVMTIRDGPAREVPKDWSAFR